MKEEICGFGPIIYVSIGQILKYFPELWGISKYSFCKIMGQILEKKRPTIKRYFTRGISKSITCDALLTAIEQTYQTIISNPNISDEKKKHMEMVHSRLDSGNLDILRSLYKLAEATKDIDRYLKEDFRMWLTVNAFLCGGYLTGTESYSLKDIEWLRASLRKYPPKESLKFRT